jgi:Rrf2 family transcriptional repressor of oqxAB
MLSLALADRNSVSQLSSAELAKSLGANPSFVRKLLVPLVQSKLLRSQMGKTGGVRLARPAAEITLRDIYGAVVADTKIWAPRTGIPHRCLVSSHVQGYFEELIDDAQEAILSMLGQRTLLQALTDWRFASVRRGPPAKFDYRYKTRGRTHCKMQWRRNRSF